VLGKSVIEIAQHLGTHHSSTHVVKGYAVDSRQVFPGFVFFALRGQKVDGHDFLLQAKERGAICAIVDKRYQGTVEGLDLIAVDDVLSCLHTLARKKIREFHPRCIGITGSMGKTTTKEFLSTLLSGSFHIEKTEGNANSQTHFPLQVLSWQKHPEIFLAEMGMSQKGEISRLVSIAPPDISLVTNVTLAHAANFPRGVEEIAEAKAEILSHPHTKRAFIERKASGFPAFQQRKDIEITCYGEGSDVYLICTGSTWSIRMYQDQSPAFSLPFTATHLVNNFLSAAVVARDLGVSWEEIISRIPLLQPYQMRFEVIQRDGITYINDCYNAIPDAVRAALCNLPAPKSGRKTIAVLGQMGELGRFSHQEHASIGALASQRVDVLLSLGEDTVPMTEQFALSGKRWQRAQDIEELRSLLRQEVCEGDVVLIKGSHTLKLWKLLEAVV